MNKSLKYISVVVCIIIIMIISCAATLLLSTEAMQGFIMFMVKDKVEGITVRDIIIGEQQYQFPCKLLFKRVSIELVQDKEETEVFLKEFSVNIKSKKSTELVINEGEIKASLYELEGVDVKLFSKDNKTWEGPMSIGEAQSSNLFFKNINARLKINSENIKLSKLYGQGYDGSFSGEAHVKLKPEGRYSINSRIKFQKLDSVRMKNFNDAIFSQIIGRISGDIEVDISEAGLERFNIEAFMREGGKVKGRLLAPLLSQVPSSIQKNKLELIIKNDDNIVVEKGQVNIKNVDSEKVKTDVKLNSKEMNLDMNVTVDINVENGIKNLVEYIVKFSKTTEGL